VVALGRAKGVVVDGPTTNSFTAPIYGTLSAFPNVVVDSLNGSLIVNAFYGPAEVPTSSYRLGSPLDLGICDDLYAMTHADPEYWTSATKATFLNFILAGGSLWASCHSVSAVEAFAPTYL